MKVFVDCWRQSLAAVALAAVLGPASGDPSRTLAAEGEHHVPLVKVDRVRRPAKRGASSPGPGSGYGANPERADSDQRLSGQAATCALLCGAGLTSSASEACWSDGAQGR